MVAGLIDVLEDTFPVVRRIVGDEFFSAMARVYVMANPPRSPVLLKYGATFPAFLRTFEPAQELPYLPDVAAIEFAWLKAYYAPDQQPLDRHAFLAVREASAPQLRLVLHPSAEVLRSAFPATTIWHANRGQEVIDEIRLHQEGEDALIVRPRGGGQRPLATPWKRSIPARSHGKKNTRCLHPSSKERVSGL